MESDPVMRLIRVRRLQELAPEWRFIGTEESKTLPADSDAVVFSCYDTDANRAAWKALIDAKFANPETNCRLLFLLPPPDPTRAEFSAFARTADKSAHDNSLDRSHSTAHNGSAHYEGSPSETSPSRKWQPFPPDRLHRLSPPEQIIRRLRELLLDSRPHNSAEQARLHFFYAINYDAAAIRIINNAVHTLSLQPRRVLTLHLCPPYVAPLIEWPPQEAQRPDKTLGDLLFLMANEALNEEPDLNQYLIHTVDGRFCFNPIRHGDDIMTCPPEVLARTFRLLEKMLQRHDLSCCVIGSWLSSAQLKAIAPCFDSFLLIPPPTPQQRNYLEQETQSLIPLLKPGCLLRSAESDAYAPFSNSYGSFGQVDPYYRSGNK